ncbi:3-deoxy-manno-octulosonate cytidylyltransferase [Leptolyngbya sp. 7M]|uniref:3-deoxy-manno-octulosonate cytidylyltransferase n=1 Tax=Leptolyngbya sp. 7M TaxID=2812896 RepID=UPI001B8D442F|nr:3-deoxy-manno-octulosonate cytidylyltransferase [Leptolyngbya sp. 7M]QYO66974.1 3-deoxy-manno-octulosonate cytidylyltransferase [Leptolyngbya sp. 7M]
MERHGENPPKNVVAIIPARYASTRLPGKMLLEIVGKPLIVHTADRAREAGSVSRVIVATDDERILKAAEDAGHEALLTRADHLSGSDRVAEVAEALPEFSVIVNVQGDEPVISPETIDQAVRALIDEPSAEMATTFEKIGNIEELLDPNIVKIAVGENGNAVYFSRSPIPFPRETAMRHGGDLVNAVQHEPELLRSFHKHTGLYVYRREFLLRFTKMRTTRLERSEMLEQLRALENGARIKAVESISRSIGVDTEADLKLVRALLEAEQKAHEIVA